MSFMKCSPIVFLECFLRMEIDFVIDLLPNINLILIPLYKIVPSNLKELKDIPDKVFNKT